MGVLYILDEPSIGLHQRDNERLLRTLRGSARSRESVLVVEHDEDTIRARRFHLSILVRVPGIHGGEIVAQGTPAEVASPSPRSSHGPIPAGELPFQCLGNG